MAEADPIISTAAEGAAAVTLPARPEGLRLDPKQTAVVVIDMQNGFYEPVWGRRNNAYAERNGLLVLDQWRRTGRQVVVVAHEPRQLGQHGRERSLFPWRHPSDYRRAARGRGRPCPNLNGRTPVAPRARDRRAAAATRPLRAPSEKTAHVRKLSGALAGRYGHMTAPRAQLHGVRE